MQGNFSVVSLEPTAPQKLHRKPFLSLGRHGFLYGLNAHIAPFELPSRFFPLGKIYSVALLLVGLPAQSAATCFAGYVCEPLTWIRPTWATPSVWTTSPTKQVAAFHLAAWASPPPQTATLGRVSISARSLEILGRLPPFFN